MRRTRRVWCSLLAVGLVAGLAACGSGKINDPSPGPSATPVAAAAPCTQSTVEQDTEGIDPRTLIYFDFPVPEGGRLDVTLDWTAPASRMGFYLVPANTCSLDEFNNRSCNFLIRSESGSKPRKISTPNFNAGNYRWIVGNFAEVPESYSLQIVLSKGGCAALAGAPPAAAQRNEGGGQLPAMERMTHRH
jgi:hypothetical protein